MTTHIFLPQDGTRLFNQSHQSAIESVQMMSDDEDSDDFVFIMNANVSKQTALNVLEMLKEYIEKDLV